MVEKPSTLVSVVIPAYNHQRYVGDAVESVLAQSVRDIEIIVIDDGSKDKTPDIVESIKDPRITFVRQQNQGAHNTINRGISMARAPWIAILNSDDLFHREKLERHLEFHARHKGAIASASRIQYISRSGAPLGPKDIRVKKYEDEKNRAAQHSSLFKSLLEYNHLITSSALVIHRDAVKISGGFIPLRYTHDWFMFLSLAAEDNLAILEEPLVSYRLHGKNTIRENQLLARTEMHFLTEWHIFEALSKPEPSLELVEAFEILGGNVLVHWDVICFFQLWRSFNNSDLSKATAIFEERGHPVVQHAMEVLKRTTPGWRSRRRLEDMLNSRSWKITAPMRRMHELLIRFRQ